MEAFDIAKWCKKRREKLERVVGVRNWLTCLISHFLFNWIQDIFVSWVQQTSKHKFLPNKQPEKNIMMMNDELFYNGMYLVLLHSLSRSTFVQSEKLYWGQPYSWILQLPFLSNQSSGWQRNKLSWIHLTDLLFTSRQSDWRVPLILWPGFHSTSILISNDLVPLQKWKL